MKVQAGFTLIELIITVTIAGVLMTVGIPSFREIIVNSQISSQANEFIADLNYARSVAVTKKNTISICPSTNSTSCGTGNQWELGWIVIDTFNSANTVLRAHGPLNGGITLSSGAVTQIQYSNSGTANAQPTFQLRVSGCTGKQQRDISISPTGRPTVTTVNC